jgi:ABC-type polar amino acid transport system ATPase subunit
MLKSTVTLSKKVRGHGIDQPVFACLRLAGGQQRRVEPAVAVGTRLLEGDEGTSALAQQRHGNVPCRAARSQVKDVRGQTGIAAYEIVVAFTHDRAFREHSPLAIPYCAQYNT